MLSGIRTNRLGMWLPTVALIVALAGGIAVISTTRVQAGGGGQPPMSDLIPQLVLAEAVSVTVYTQAPLIGQSVFVVSSSAPNAYRMTKTSPTHFCVEKNNAEPEICIPYNNVAGFTYSGTTK
ncbi:MAG TPA: hypothetical protein VMT34_05780 [Aggregatilineales bacterium]|nr:hypothetical protein [Aggregatilineales bacterium]